ncbi:MAG: O-methyltransferase [Chloroflexi bacterium]|nr:MAG: O-methyltransferase [Chloroflexota bacterium]
MTVYNDRISQYVIDLFAVEDDALQYARENSLNLGLPSINVKPEEGKFLQILARISGGEKVVEIGTLGGYSGIWIARGLLPHGRLITLEKDPRHAEIAREHFNRAGVNERIEIRIGNAHEQMERLVREGPFDMVFVDAEKPGYGNYYRWSVENVRSGGIIAIHNAFRKGSVAGMVKADAYTEIMQEFNANIAADSRVISTIYPAGDGTIIAVKV